MLSIDSFGQFMATKPEATPFHDSSGLESLNPPQMAPPTNGM